MKYLLLSIFIFLSFLSYSQQTNTLNTSNFFNKLSKKSIELKTAPGLSNKSFSFSGTRVIDKRFDTSAIGYMRLYKPVYENCQLTTLHELKYELERFVNNLIPAKNTRNDSCLVIVIRKFMVYKKYYIGNKKILKGNIFTRYAFNLGIDCFSLTDSLYTPLIKKDTVIIMDPGFKESEKGVLISSSLGDVLNSLSLDSIVHSIVHRKKFKLDELNEYYNTGTHLSILSDTILKKGVYRNFDEFKRNAPFYPDFEVKEGKQTIIYLISGKDTVPTRELWGYCNGRSIYIKNGDNLVELRRRDKSFAFMGNRELINVQREARVPFEIFSQTTLWLPAAIAGMSMWAPDRFQNELVPLQLDMESGKVY